MERRNSRIRRQKSKPAKFRNSGTYEGDRCYPIHAVTCVQSTDMAICIESTDLKDEWIPLSQVHIESDVHDVNDEGTLVISEWLAERKGWL